MPPQPPARDLPYRRGRRRGASRARLALAAVALALAGVTVVAWLALRGPAVADRSLALALAPAPAVRASIAGRSALRPWQTAPSEPPRGRAADPSQGAPAGDEAPEAPDPEPPTSTGGLTRADVVAGIDGVRAQLARCPRDRPAIGVVKMTVSSSGRVVSAQVFGGLAGTAAGECLAGVARGAAFRSNRREQTVISWPVAIGHPRGPVGAVETGGPGGPLQIESADGPGAPVRSSPPARP